ncbi:Sphingomyelin phosphodiesterase [Halocaridina rubra]|uniref:Sphingomyelin phosphodiesterase n=1 Tax=Halocaridina rubra TaxID=373956 RepID=A0AAN8WLH2_HALRR
MGNDRSVAIVILLLICFSTSVEALQSDPLRKIRLQSAATGPEDHFLRGYKANTNDACLACEVVVLILQEEIDLGVSYDNLTQEAILLCEAVSNYTQPFCQGYVPLVGPIVYHILTTNEVEAQDFCGMMMSSRGCATTNPYRDWSIQIHGEKPPVVPITLPDLDQPTLKVLHLADTHLDPFYLPGSNADCHNHLCCRADSGVPEFPEAGAWFWGDYRHCGSPRWMLEDMLTHIVNQHPDISYIIWTGDVVPHNKWSTTNEFNTQVVKETNDMMIHFFPDIPIFPVAGNHEMNPLDSFPNPEDYPEELSAEWLYEAMVDQWSRIVPGMDNATVLYGGFYSVLLKPAFRIISINSMFGYSSNLWLIENSTDVAFELQWLESELGKAEDAGELVHLLGHVPAGLIETERTWSREYNRIVQRYENIIRGQFFGHTHFDEYEVFLEGDRPIGVAYIAPSQTPWYDYNPSYRIYVIDGDRPDTTRLVLDHTTYTMNLTEAHETNVTRWFELYNAKRDYGMASLTPYDWMDLAYRMAENRTLFDVYWKHFVSAADPYLSEGCDDMCYEQRLCDVMTSNRNNLDACYGIVGKKQSAKSAING